MVNSLPYLYDHVDGASYLNISNKMSPPLSFDDHLFLITYLTLNFAYCVLSFRDIQLNSVHKYFNNIFHKIILINTSK